MNRVREKNLLWISLVALLLTSAVMTGTVTSSSSARMYVDPTETTGIEPPATFTIDIKADVGVGAEPTLYGWDFILSFNPGLLQVASHLLEDWKVDTWYGNGTQTTFQTIKWPVVPDSEEVYVDDVPMNKPDDYTIDYSTGNITFTTAPGLDAEIIAMYQFSATVYHVTSGHFLEETGWATAWGSGHVAPDVDNLNGLVGAGDAIMADEATGELPLEGAYGTGKLLATIEFQVIGWGVCGLDLESTELATVVGLPPHQTFAPIEHTVEHGLFDNRPENDPPKANFIAPTQALVGEEVTFDASGSTDDGWIQGYEWDFGYEREYKDQWIALGISKTDRWTGDNETKSFITTEKPIEGSEKVYVNDKPEDYTIDYETGNITFTTAPELNAAVKAEYLYLQKSFVTTEKPIVPGSEEVYVDETLMAKPADYTIDYETGNITFTTAPEKDAKVKAFYSWRAQGSGMTPTHTFTKAGTFTVTLTVYDNDGANDTASQGIEISTWMVGGDFPDLVGWQAKAERHRLNEDNETRGMYLCSKVGNPSSDTAYEVYVEFTLFSKDEGTKLGTLTTPTDTLEPGDKSELRAYFNITDPTWRAFSGPALTKYIGFASAYHNVSSGFVKGLVEKDFGFNVLPVEHDIAVLEVTTNATNGVPEGNRLEIYVNMTNEGPLEEPFCITVTYQGATTPETVLEVRPTKLEGGETRIETFTLDTSGMTTERYVIKAILSTLIYETDTIDNKGFCVVDIE